MPYDVLIQGGTVVDGSGLPAYRGDVGVTDGRIVAIGDLKGQAAKEKIDAQGLVVSPGFVDGHTHMDAQVFWDSLGTCAVWHGVTSVVMGNCGFSLAPCAQKDRRLVFSNLERAEDISPAAMEAGIPWSWTTFPEYLDAVDKLPKAINYAGYVGHSALRSYVMGQRSFTEKATDDDMKAMKGELEAGIRAGAIGFSTSRSFNHRTAEGHPVASRVGPWSEVEELVGVLGKLRTGVFEISREDTRKDPERRALEQNELKTLALETGVPTTFGGSWYHRGTNEDWRSQFAMVDEVNANGGKMLVQGSATWNGSLRSFESLMPYDKAPIWAEFRKLPLDEQERGLRDPEMRARLVEAAKNFKYVANPAYPNAYREVDWNWIFPLYKPLPPYKSMAELSKETGKHPVDLMIDLALEKHLKLFFIAPSNNEDQDYVLAMIRHPRSCVTFSDSGAHVNSVINPVQTHLLGHWVRNAQAITLEAAVRKITHDVASFWGLKGRGMLKVGNHGDVVVFDPKTISPQMPEMVYDLPTNAQRLLQKADGIRVTMVNGEILLRDGVHTGALPGKVMRGPLAARN
jgi:N-acyl-D-aspartate/D-glutamate deacylase